FTPNAAGVLFVDVAIQQEVRFIAKQRFAYENRGTTARQSRFGPFRRIYALLDDRFDELPNQTENKSLGGTLKSVAILEKTRDFVTRTIVRVGRYLSHCSCKARATIDLLKDTFGDRLISRFGPVNWPPRSCDLTPLDYFLWGYVKSLVYADTPQTLDHLEDNIRRVIADIRPQMLEKVIRKLDVQIDYIRASRGSPMPEIIFKM
ncbi:hypothetical protein TNCV_4543431, partial [Trichonephila clavipes]